jgi:NADH pyrophosphatase NudC (nudix superfamily)
MNSKCPGQDFRNLKVSLCKCPECGKEVEIFSDELRVKCRSCGAMVYPDRVPSCIEWCKNAKKCLGEEKWKNVMEALNDI